MTRYVVEKVMQVVINEDDFEMCDGEPSEALALDIARDIDSYEWEQVGIYVVGTK